MGGHQRRDERLIERARSGERAAQQQIWRAHRRWVAAILLAHRPRSVEVDDLMQEVAVKFISKIGTLRDPAAFKPWLRRIAINICRGAARSDRPLLRLADGSRPESETDRGGVAPPAADEIGQAEGVEQRDAAARLLGQVLTLPPEYREPLLLRCLRSLSYQQISEVLELPVTTVETRLARARRMLREEMGDDVFDVGGA